MATELRTRTEPLLFDLARLEQEPEAMLGYHREIQRRIAYLLPPLGETLRLAPGEGLQAGLSERASLLGVATLGQTVCSCSRSSFEKKGWRWQITSLARIRQRCAQRKNRPSCQRAYAFKRQSRSF